MHLRNYRWTLMALKRAVRNRDGAWEELCWDEAVRGRPIVVKGVEASICTHTGHAHAAASHDTATTRHVNFLPLANSPDVAARRYVGAIGMPSFKRLH